MKLSQFKVSAGFGGDRNRVSPRHFKDNHGFTVNLKSDEKDFDAENEWLSTQTRGKYARVRHPGGCNYNFEEEFDAMMFKMRFMG